MRMSLSLSRQVLLRDIEFDQVVRTIRATSFAWNIRMFTQYCWVDWNKTYELSVTIKRQNRCLKNYFDNAAMYWEPLLRNSDINDITSGPFKSAIYTAMFDTINNTTRGQTWLASLWLPMIEINEEVALWKLHGLTRWQTQLTNYYEQGLQQDLIIENALGIRQRVTIHKLLSYNFV
ncbi:hypothetical protein THRCLA_00288 [Thraustotheca clavata]|uniref:Uncharacterized protein n=1 Tax=Thraustotheca clavata TaxID=74557 RepID=A0A1W0ABZ4_9STRA|nr:hypothetical protein THRCLA_00288 [Thraustotheca clavata]